MQVGNQDVKSESVSEKLGFAQVFTVFDCNMEV